MAEKKKIAVIATGGTIAGTGPAGDAAGYRAGELPVEEVVSSVPGLGGNRGSGDAHGVSGGFQ